VRLGIGDDAAVLEVPPGQQLVVTTDMLVAGRHFPAATDPEAIGHKALAVNLSDLAAMGAEPAWVTLAISLPAADAAWLTAFCRGFLGLARAHRAALVGGDTVRGPLAVTVQAMGFVPAGAAIRRAGARPGDGVFVTGTLGDAALGLQCLQGRLVLAPDLERLARARLERPSPRVREGLALRGLASAMIDISDGLLADLGHLLVASGAGAAIDLRRVPLSAAYRAFLHQGGDLQPALAFGDDYELCFTAAPGDHASVRATLDSLGCAVQQIGTVTREPGLVDERGQVLATAGHDHFRADD